MWHNVADCGEVFAKLGDSPVEQLTREICVKPCYSSTRSTVTALLLLYATPLSQAA
jgi:hypothetical protein